jgi:hypothetical protein
MKNLASTLVLIGGSCITSPAVLQAADFPLTGYRVTLGRTALPGMDPTDPDKWCAAGIRCIQGGGGGKDLLDICFMPSNVPLPRNTSAGTTHVMYRPISELPYYIDLMRNEKPLVMTIDSARPERHRINTGVNAEPVGEGEP